MNYLFNTWPFLHNYINCVCPRGQKSNLAAEEVVEEEVETLFECTYLGMCVHQVRDLYELSLWTGYIFNDIMIVIVVAFVCI